MYRTVIISKLAEKKLEILFNFLLTKWSYKVKNEFILKLDQSISLIKKFPESFPSSKKRKRIKKMRNNKTNNSIL